MPPVWMVQQLDQLRGCLARVIEWWRWYCVCGTKSINTAAVFIDAPGVVVQVSGVAVIPVGHVDRAVGSELDVYGPEVAVVACDDGFDIARLPRRSIRADFGHHEVALQWIGG